MTVYDDTRTAVWPEVAMTDAERQALAKKHQRAMRTAKTKVNRLVDANHRRRIDDVDGLRPALEKLVQVCQDAFDAFDQPGMYWPDNWHEYRNAYEAARQRLWEGMAFHVH